MNRKAAIDKLLIVAEETAASGQYKISNTINDLARRIALSSYKMSDKQVIRDNVSRLAAELMFRDNFKMAKLLTKIAEDLNIGEEEESEIPPALMTPEEAAQSNQDYMSYLEARLQDPDLSDFEREQIQQKLNESSSPEVEETTEDKTESTTNFLDTMRDLGVSIRLPKDLLN